jgi:hypothetical protein
MNKGPPNVNMPRFKQLSHWPLTRDDRVQGQVSARGVCGVKSGNGTGLSFRSMVLSCQYLFTSALYSFICHQHHIVSATDSVVK